MQFQHIMLIGVAVGVVTSILFHLGTPEPPPTSYSRSNSVDSAAQENGGNSVQVVKRKMSPRKFLNVPQFYQVALLYMCTRLFANLSQVWTFLLTSGHVCHKILFFLGLRAFVLARLTEGVGRGAGHCAPGHVLVQLCHVLPRWTPQQILRQKGWFQKNF